MSLLDTIDNFYERLVADAVEESRLETDTEDRLADIMCIALNRLPPRYYRHKIDMMFYLADPELQEMRYKVLDAVKEARAFVVAHQRE
ncbi:late competence development ComFB family protein [Marinobacter caseinilyticus]|uniref:late competence development ComFB family protein n=1 Tax=Marinobacter caseinilyticus TaxID=2692195 RepID=UPI00140E8DC4|nr:late competence development ComFB family protein [Marinobacter caseinilyticus]